MDTDDENHFEYALGFAVVRRWGDLPPEIQELLFNEATAGDDSLRQGLATFLQKSTPRRSTCSSDQQCRLETTLWNKIEVSSWFQCKLSRDFRRRLVRSRLLPARRSQTSV